jgi:molecular chaperone DnaJ
LTTHTKPDYYELLGIQRTATEKEIQASFQKLAAEFKARGGPRNIDDVERMRMIATAYRVLSDVNKRRRYDQLGHSFIGDHSNRLARRGPDKLDDVLRRFEELYESWGSSTDAF